MNVTQPPLTEAPRSSCYSLFSWFQEQLVSLSPALHVSPRPCRFHPQHSYFLTLACPDPSSVTTLLPVAFPSQSAQQYLSPRPVALWLPVQVPERESDWLSSPHPSSAY